jgi:hypothetical protein
MVATKRADRRIRWTLVVLLWLWVGCIALVLDLFWNVSVFDRVRPDATLYRATRYVAHRLVGERYAEDDAFGRTTPEVAPYRPERTSTIRLTDYRVGPKPDAATPAGARMLDGLARVARTSPDPKLRIAALRSMARMFKADARAELERASNDDDVTVRAAAVGFLEETTEREAR